VVLAAQSEEGPPRRRYEARRESVLRTERLWALANELASGETAPERSPIRGITYVRTARRRLTEKGERVTDGNYQLLSRQGPYGALGIYGAVASALRFLDSTRTLEATPDLGLRLGEAFIAETAMPDQVRRCIKDGRPIGLDTLAAWGKRASVGGNPGQEEAACLSEAMAADPVRKRMGHLLANCPDRGNGEQARMAAILRRLKDGEERDLAAAMRAIIPFESACRSLRLVLERLLWHCDHSPLYQGTADAVAADAEVVGALRRLPDAAAAYAAALETSVDVTSSPGTDRLLDVGRLFAEAAAAPDSGTLARVVQRRHADVQHGKVDGGRRKTPWVVVYAGGFVLTAGMAADRLRTEPSMDTVAPHPYRFSAADNLLAAGRSE